MQCMFFALSNLLTVLDKVAEVSLSCLTLSLVLSMRGTM